MYIIGLTAVVNNAGIGRLGLIKWETVERMQNVMDVNFWGTIRVIKSMLPLLKKAKGRIVNMSSMGGNLRYIFYRAVVIFFSKAMIN